LASTEPLGSIEPLDEAHVVVEFDCGVPALNEYLTEGALPDQEDGASRTYVATRAGRVVGFFTLAASRVDRGTATGRVAATRSRHAVPAILLARLALDVSEQGHGLGEALLVEALRRYVQAADIVGARVVLVHAKDERAVSFYARYGFEQSPIGPLHLMRMMQDIREDLGEAAEQRVQASRSSTLCASPLVP
jgi:GNAT superfamily N-acetyltransferase